MTLKARRLLGTCPVVAHFCARRHLGNAWSTVEACVDRSQTVLRLEYPVTTEPVAAERYEREIAAFYASAARAVAAHLDAGQDVAVVCEGDPFFYGSYMHLHHRLAGKYPTTVVPGVTSVAAACAAAGTPLVAMGETLAVVPGTLPAEALARTLADADAAVVMKVGRHLDDVREALGRAGRDSGAVYVERASCSAERVVPIADTDGVEAPYFSLVLVPGRALAERPGRR
jgi:precorrin-2 C(20)-methyltransferase